MCHIYSWWEAAVEPRQPSSGLCDDLEGREGAGGGGRGIRTQMTGSHCCTAETNTTL